MIATEGRPRISGLEFVDPEGEPVESYYLFVVPKHDSGLKALIDEVLE